MALVKCTECGNEVATTAAACPKCGAPVPKGRPKPKALLFVLGGLGLLLGTCLIGVVAAAVKPSGASGSSPPPAEASRWVDIRKLLAEYGDNEVRADSTFKGRYVLIDGIVSDVKRDLLNSIYITIGTGQLIEVPQVQCFFSEAHAAQAAKFSKGSKITVRGRVNGLMGNVIIRDCEFP